MYAETEENRFLEVTTPTVTRSPLLRINPLSRTSWTGQEDGDQGLPGERSQGPAGLHSPGVDEFSENEDLPNTTNPDDRAYLR